MTTHKLIVNNDHVIPPVIEIGAEGSFGTEFIEPSFSDEWDGLSIKAVFHPKRGRPVEMLWCGKALEVPPEMMKHSGNGGLIFSGYKLTESGNGEIVFPKLKSRPCTFVVPHTLGDVGGNSIPETPGVYEQLREGVKEDLANGIVEALQRAKDSGDFKGDKGDKGEPGAKGETGESGVYVLEEGETLAGVPDDFDVVVAPYDDKSIEILDRGIISVTRTDGDGSPGTYDTYTILFSDDTATTYQIYNGSDGTDGKPGKDGKPGEDGKNFAILGYYDTLEALQTAVPSPSAGDAYNVGTATPYDTYIYDGVNKVWVNNGAMNGVKGDKGEKGDPGEPGKDGVNGTNGKDGTNGKSVEMQYSGGNIQWRYVGDTAWNTLVSVGTTVAEGNTEAVTGGAVYAYVNGLIGDFLNGES